MKIDKSRVKGNKVARGHRDNVQFELQADAGSLVFVAGTFNNWNPEANPLTHQSDQGHFVTALHVPNGTHQYKFVVDGVWMSDPNCSDWTTNEYGSMNSVIHV